MKSNTFMFSAGTVTADTTVKVGGTASLTCKITGADLTKFINWSAGHGTTLKAGEKLSVSTSHDTQTGTFKREFNPSSFS